MNKIEPENFTTDLLLGEWSVQSRILGNSNASDIFAGVGRHIFRPGSRYELHNGQIHSGQWGVILKDPLAGRPVLSISIAGQKPASAIITRLLMSQDRRYAQATINFSTGLELVLIKQNSK